MIQIRVINPIILLILCLQSISIALGYLTPVRLERGMGIVTRKPLEKPFVLYTTTSSPSTSRFNYTLHEYDSWNKQKLVQFRQSPHITSEISTPATPLLTLLSQGLYRCFLPSGDLSADYYSYTVYRAIQRLLAATNQVFCTQALFIALGLKKSSAIGLGAATVWVLKDGLGKVSRIIWATAFGKKFDSDAKKWRFRSALIFMLGNALEIFTYLYPRFFLLTAAIANALKQMSTLTYSSTRNTIYKSFARNLDNIGDITAKGEAQGAVIDIVGMLTGVAISRALNASKRSVILTFLILSVLDLVSGWFEIRSVVFNSLNFESTRLVLPIVYDILEASSHNQTSLANDERAAHLSPSSIAKKESLLFSRLPVDRYFATWSKLRIPPLSQKDKVGDDAAAAVARRKEEVTSAAIDRSVRWNDGKFLLFLHLHSNPLMIAWERIKRSLRLTSSSQIISRKRKGGATHHFLITPQILVHKQASSEDVFQSVVILHRLLYLLRREDQSEEGSKEVFDEELIHSTLEEAQRFYRENGGRIREILVESGWDMDRMMFGLSVIPRVEW